MSKVVTFGCRLNIYESALIQQMADDENTIIVNTCAVTKEAERQARQAIRKLRKENPDAEIIVTGCSAQIKSDMYAQMSEVNRVIGNQDKLKAENYKKLDKVIVSDIMEIKEITPHLVSHFENKARAFIQIQNGCNHRCTFCTIPYARGNSRSIPLGEIEIQIKKLIQQNYKEFVITGVDITDYGLDLPGSPSLSQTLKRLLDLVPELKRLRISSVDPSELDEDFWNIIQDERIMPHLHMSMQSGNDLILKRMKRRHLRKHIFEFIEKARNKRSNIALGADIIVGFPTETEEMFNESKQIAEMLDFIHIFPYSAHENTPSARMPQLSKHTIKERSKRLHETKKICFDRLLKKWNKQTTNMLVEKIDNGIAFGKTDHFIPVQSKIINNVQIGDIIKIYSSENNSNEIIGMHVE